MLIFTYIALQASQTGKQVPIYEAFSHDFCRNTKTTQSQIALLHPLNSQISNTPSLDHCLQILHWGSQEGDKLKIIPQIFFFLKSGTFGFNINKWSMPLSE